MGKFSFGTCRQSELLDDRRVPDLSHLSLTDDRPLCAQWIHNVVTQRMMVAALITLQQKENESYMYLV